MKTPEQAHRSAIRGYQLLLMKGGFLMSMVMAIDTVHGQDGDCITPYVPVPANGPGPLCNDATSYVPDQSADFSNTPNLVFKLNFHFLRPTNGTGPYAGDQTTNVDNVIGYLNWIYGVINPPVLDYPLVEEIPDSRIRFEKAGIHYHDDNQYYQVQSIGCGGTFQNLFGVDVTRTFNIYYYTLNTVGGGYGCGPFPYVNMGHGDVVAWASIQLLAHELGHVLGLPHTFDCDGNGNCLDDAFSDTWTPDCNTTWANSGVNAAYTNSGTLICPFHSGVGISNNIMGYNTDRAYLSPLQMAAVHKLYITNAVRREYVVCHPHTDNPPIHITSDTEWHGSKILNADLYVEQGATLTMRCAVYCSPHVAIYVKQGGKLVLDGATLTAHSSDCEDFWRGVQVWGTAAQHQDGAPVPEHQGMLVLKNGARIEHAREGVQTMNPNDWTTMGGVVQAYGTASEPVVFLNCRRAISFIKYQNFNPNNPAQLRPNRSYFNYCHFVVDDNYRGVDDFYAHVSMWYVDGINFRACSFRNEQNNVIESSKLGKGIISMDAKYTVTGKCNVILPCCNDCPEVNWTKGMFVGLDHGIHALNGVTDRAFTVDRCRFENNILGVFASGMTNYSVTRNEFEFGNRAVTLDGDVDDNFQNRHRAIFSFESSGFRIEENDLSRDPNPNSSECDGVVVSTSMDHNTQVYRNTASGMEHAYIGEGQCVDLSFAPSIGLQFLCNGNSGNAQDIWARISNQHNDPGWHAIRTQQGSSAKSAGNTFDQAPPPGDASDYRNSTDWSLGYWHDGGTSAPVDYTPGYVSPALTTNANQCESRFNNGGGHVLSVVKKDEEEQEMLDRKDAYISTAYLFNSLLDGGNTDEVVEEVVESWPQDAWELRGYLMAKSPYLSTVVLKEMMEHNTLPLPMVLEICVANPEATKQDGFIRWAQFEAPNPLPNYMVDLIVDSWEEGTLRRELEAIMGQHHADMSRAGHMLLVHFKNDTITEPTDSLKLLWASLPNFGARVAQAMTMVQRGEYGEAIAQLDQARENYPMKGGREAEIDRAIAYYTFLQSLALTGRDETSLTNAEVDVLANMANDTYDRPSTWIWNLLCFAYGRCRPIPSGGDQPNQRAFRPLGAETSPPPTPALVLVPNPADVAVTFRYWLNAKDAVGVIVVRDAAGREVCRLPLRGDEGQELWDTRDVAPGAYSIDLLRNGARIATEPLLIKR